jgi:hypothetical protein
MRSRPTTFSPGAGLRSRGSLSQRFRVWRRQPRKQSSRLFWGLLGLTALLDTFLIGLTIYLLFFTRPATPGWASRVEGDGPARRPWAACLLAAGMLGTSLAARARRPLPARGLHVAGLLGYAVVVGSAVAVSTWPQDGAAAGLTWAALLAGALGLLLDWTGGSRVSLLAGALVSAVLLFGADCWPGTAGPELPGWSALRHGGARQATGGLLVLAGYGALALAWGLGNLTLLRMLFAPHRACSIRVLSDGVFRALRLGVVLLAVGALLGGFPGWCSREACDVAVVLAGVLLLHARFAGWVQDLGLALGCAAGFAALVLAWGGLAWLPAANPAALACCGWLFWSALATASLALHATRRYWFASPDRPKTDLDDLP